MYFFIFVSSKIYFLCFSLYLLTVFIIPCITGKVNAFLKLF
nr:MAG TPA: hypothetical protein [Caudoviricetes sp.]